MIQWRKSVISTTNPISGISLAFPRADIRFYFNEDQMAVEKLSEGIRYKSKQGILTGRKFAADAVTLKDILREKISSK